MCFYNCNFYLMVTGFHMSCYRIDVKAVSPVFLKIAIEDHCRLFVVINDHSSNRRRLFHTLSVLNRHTAAIDFKGNTVSLLPCSPSVSENLTNIILWFCISLKSAYFRGGIVILITNRILIRTCRNRHGKHFPIKIRWCFLRFQLFIYLIKKSRDHLRHQCMTGIIGMQVIRCNFTVFNPSFPYFGPDGILHADHGKLVGFRYLKVHVFRIFAVIISDIIHQHHSGIVYMRKRFPDKALVSFHEEFCIIIIHGKFNQYEVRIIF